MSEAPPTASWHDHLSGWADLVRLPNLPTALTNALLGMAIGLYALRAELATTGDPFNTRTAQAYGLDTVDRLLQHEWALAHFIAAGGWRLLAGAALLYIGGMAMHDWADAKRDTTDKPTRPIPAGQMLRNTAGAWAILGLALGLMLLSAWGPATAIGAILVLGCIVAYNLTHHRWAGSVVLLGLTRGLLILTCATPFAEWRWILSAAIPLALLVVVYVSLVSVLARGEDDTAPARQGRLVWGILIVALLPVLWVAPVDPATLRPYLASLAMSLITGAGLVFWLVSAGRRARSSRVGPAVGMYLAGIALLDAYILALMVRPGSSGVALALFALAVGLQAWRRAGRVT